MFSGNRGLFNMKQVLNFQSEQEFQNFFGQLTSAELPDFQAVEGAGGDKGFDGLSNNTAYQVFYPTNRTSSKYIKKIDEDINKMLKSKGELGLTIEKWILIVPEDLAIDVVAHLQKKSKETDLQCTYWGATKLTEMLNKYPHVKNAFPGIFLPDLQDEMNGLQGSINRYLRPRNSFNVEIITDDDFISIDKGITEKYHAQSQGVQRRFAGTSAVYAADEAYRQQANASKRELRRKKDASDRAYQLKIEELEDVYQEACTKIRESMNMRGIPGSGIEKKELDKASSWKSREIEKLNLKYGKRNNA